MQNLSCSFKRCKVSANLGTLKVKPCLEERCASMLSIESVGTLIAVGLLALLEIRQSAVVISCPVKTDDLLVVLNFYTSVLWVYLLDPYMIQSRIICMYESFTFFQPTKKHHIFYYYRLAEFNILFVQLWLPMGQMLTWCSMSYILFNLFVSASVLLGEFLMKPQCTHYECTMSASNVS